MKTRFLAAPFLALVAGVPANALDFGNGFYLDGEIELEFFGTSGGGSDEELGYGSVDLGYEQPGGGFGFFVGVDAISLFTLSETALYGAVSYSGGFGKLQFGVPRPALDDYLETPIVGGLRFFEVIVERASKSVITPVYLLSDSDAPVGARYDGSFGSTKVGVSLSRIEDTNILDIAVNYPIGETVLRAGIERVWAGGSNETTFHLGAEAQLGPVKAGLLYSDAEDVFGGRLGQLYAVYTPIDRLNLTGVVWHQSTTSDSRTLYGLAADYSLSETAYVEAGFADGDGFDSVYNVSLGLKF